MCGDFTLACLFAIKITDLSTLKRHCTDLDEKSIIISRLQMEGVVDWLILCFYITEMIVP